MSDLIPCEHCDQPIARNAMKCPHCGGIPTWKTRPQILVAIIGALIAAGVAAYFAFVLAHQPAAPRPPVPAPAPVPPAAEAPVRVNPAQPDHR